MTDTKRDSSASQSVSCPQPKRGIKKGDRVRKFENGRRLWVDDVFETPQGRMAVVVDDTPFSRSPRERILCATLILAN